MSKRKIATIGEPIFILTQNNFSDRIKVTTGFNSLNTLSYIGVNAIKVMSVGYTDDKMEKIIYNKDYKDDKNNDISIVVDAEEPSGRKRTSMDVFVDEAEANAVAIQMNDQFQQECKAILDVVTQCYHEYDNIKRGFKQAK
jgi:hypothetical protein